MKAAYSIACKSLTCCAEIHFRFVIEYLPFGFKFYCLATLYKPTFANA